MRHPDIRKPMYMGEMLVLMTFKDSDILKRRVSTLHSRSKRLPWRMDVFPGRYLLWDYSTIKRQSKELLQIVFVDKIGYQPDTLLPEGFLTSGI